MMRALVVAIGLIVALARPGTVSAVGPLTVKLDPVNDSGISGTAVLTPRGDQTQIVVTIAGEPPGGSEPIHIHTGHCGAALGGIKYPLKNVEGGASTTVVDSSLALLETGGFAVNVHQSAANITTWIACGNIPWLAGSFVWSSGHDMPSPRSSAGVAVANNGRMYVMGGSSTGSPALANVDAYDPASNAWQSLAPLPTARHSLGVAMASNGRMYAVGGIGTSGKPLNAVEEYDPVKNLWQIRAGMPTARGSLSLVATENGKVYAIGGTANGREYLATVEEYDPATNTWAARAKMPTPRGDMGLTIAPDGKVYVIGGASVNGSRLTVVEAYDPTTDTWSAGAPMPTGRSSLGVVTATNRQIYAIGGSIASTEFVATIESYDPSTNTWATNTPAPQPLRSLAVAASDDGRVYLFGGCCKGNDPVGTVWVGTLASISALTATATEEPIAAPTTVSLAATSTVAPTVVPTVVPTVAPTVIPTAVTHPSATSFPVTTTMEAVGAAVVAASTPPSATLTPGPTSASQPGPSLALLGITVVAAIAVATAILLRGRNLPAQANDMVKIAEGPPAVSPLVIVPAPETPVTEGFEAPTVGGTLNEKVKNADVPTAIPPPKSVGAPVTPVTEGSEAPTVGGSPNDKVPVPPPVTVPTPVIPVTDGSKALTPSAPPIDKIKNVEGVPAGYVVAGPPMRGGFGIVCKAYQEALDRFVAIKIIAPNLTNDPEIVRRFRDEARRTARLEHPNIVPIYGFGQADNGSLYIIMRYVDGLTLQQLLARERPFAISRAIDLVRQVAEALDYAHTRGVIHRDIKPSNILVEIGDRVTLVDFGIARALGEVSTTGLGLVVGTPQYLSPEQVRGEPHIDGRADLYSLGLVLYELLAGRSPFNISEPGAMYHAHLAQPIPPPTEFRPGIPPAVVNVVMTALAKDRTQRYPSASDFLDALREAALDSIP